MPQNVLVLNCGSSSLKFAIIDAATGQEYLSGLAEKLASEAPQIKYNYNNNKTTQLLNPFASHQTAIAEIVSFINQHQLADNLVAIGHRVVHGGEAFTGSVIITDDVIASIEATSSLAPLHNPANLLGVRAAAEAFPALPQVAVFDTAFHQTMPEHAFMYAIPQSLYREHGIRRYGFHGTSHYYVTQQAASMINKPIDQLNVISAHLGNGCSVTAIKNGKSVDTSMGLTPLEGLMMGTRSGDLDPGIFSYLSEQLGYTAQQISDLLNKQSGLLGLSELSNDCRTIEQAYQSGNAQAKLALDVFCYRLAKYIASYMVPLGHIDALIFTGGIGENSSLIREKVLQPLTFLGFELDPEANLAARFGQQGCITKPNKQPQALVIPTNEEWVIALDAANLTGAN